MIIGIPLRSVSAVTKLPHTVSTVRAEAEGLQTCAHHMHGFTAAHAMSSAIVFYPVMRVCALIVSLAMSVKLFGRSAF